MRANEVGSASELRKNLLKGPGPRRKELEGRMDSSRMNGQIWPPVCTNNLLDDNVHIQVVKKDFAQMQVIVMAHTQGNVLLM